jgi:hypothetical protein
MARQHVITPGDDLALVNDLYEDGALGNLSAATIRACIQDGTGNRIVDWASQSPSASGAAWATGRVVCEFSSANSLALCPSDAFLEIEVTRSGKVTTWPLIGYDVQQGAR